MITCDCASLRETADSPCLLNGALFRIGRIMEQVVNREALLQAVAGECVSLLRCEATGLALFDPKDNSLPLAASFGATDENIANWRAELGKGFVGAVAESRIAAFSNDPQNDPRWLGDAEALLGAKTRNLAVVPIVRTGELTGALAAINRDSQAGFTAQDVSVLQVFADQAGLALGLHELIEARQESERASAIALALAEIGHSVKNCVTRLEFPIELIDQAARREDFNSFGELWPVMKRAAMDIGGLAREMLAFTKAGAEEIQMVDVAAVLRDAIEECRPQADSKGIELVMKGCDGPLPWPLAENSVRSTVFNLVGNAIEALPGESNPPRITVTLSENKGAKGLLIKVSDNGPGIPEEIQPFVFAPLFTTKEDKGTGLGLACVKKDVEKHGGTVELVSKPGEGAEFTLTFPPRPGHFFAEESASRVS